MPRDEVKPIVNQLRLLEHSLRLLKTEIASRDWAAVEEITNQVMSTVGRALRRAETLR